MFLTQGIIASRTLIISAALPAVLLLLFVYKKDRLEKESPRMLLSLVLWGVFSTAGASLLEHLGISLLSRYFAEDSLVYNICLYFVVVAFSEEGLKYIVLKWKTWRNSEFNCQFDGLVYAVFVSLGFALWENISYVFSYGLAVAVVRALTAVPGHACFGVFMGTFYGAAKRAEQYGDISKSHSLRICSLAVPALLHGLYDYLATDLSSSGDLLFLVFVVVLFIISFRLVNAMSKSDSYI